MIIPAERITEEALRSIIEAFILRDGTDYGDRELSLEEKVDELLPQVIRGDIVIVFDEKTETVNLLPKDEVQSSDTAG